MTAIPPGLPASACRPLHARARLSQGRITRASGQPIHQPGHLALPCCRPLWRAAQANGGRIVRHAAGVAPNRRLLAFVEKGHMLGRQIHAAHQGERALPSARQQVSAGDATSVLVAARRYPALQGMALCAEAMQSAHRRRIDGKSGPSGAGASASNQFNLRLLEDWLAR